MEPSERQLKEFNLLISKMHISTCRALILPALRIKWCDVSRSIQNARLPMTSPSLARVLTKQLARKLPTEELDKIIIRLRLTSVAMENRTWHLIKLVNPVSAECTDRLEFPVRVIEAIMKIKKRTAASPEVQYIQLGDFLFLSMQLQSGKSLARPLYAALLLTAPMSDVIFTSSTTSRTLLKACAIGLDYESYEDACLSGPDIYSLLRIYERAKNENNVDHLNRIPEYAPVPIINKDGIDYTNRSYNERYVDAVLGPNPPLLKKLEIETIKPFYDRSRLNKKIKMKVDLKSDDIAGTLKTWVSIKALTPTSDLLRIFNQTTSNRILYEPDD